MSNFFLLGGDGESVPDGLRIFNKVGDAYGYLIDVAYVVDFGSNIEYMIAAVIQVNENEIYNDNQYEYDSVGLPFLKAVGQIIHEYERGRNRKVKPDLSPLQSLFNTP